MRVYSERKKGKKRDSSTGEPLQLSKFIQSGRVSQMRLSEATEPEPIQSSQFNPEPLQLGKAIPLPEPFPI